MDMMIKLTKIIGLVETVGGNHGVNLDISELKEEAELVV